MSADIIDLKPGQHITTMGNVGSGKSFFNRNALLPTSSRAVILDSEQDDYPDFPDVSVHAALKLASGNSGFFVRVPTRGAIQFDEPSVEELCAGIIEKGHDMTVLLEEATDYSDASYIPPYLHALMRRARHKKVNVIISTQRPARLSKDYYSLSLHHFFFSLSDFDVERTDYAKFLSEYQELTPYGSFKCIYQAPDRSITILNPVPKYDWAARFQRMRHP